MPTFKFEARWTMFQNHEVVAENLEHAHQIAAASPLDGEYVQGSWLADEYVYSMTLDEEEVEGETPSAQTSRHLELNLLADRIRQFKTEVLCMEISDKLNGKSVQFWSLAVNDLDNAMSHLRLAAHCLGEK